MIQLPLEETQIKRVKHLAAAIAGQIGEEIADYSSTSVERTVLRLYGVDGVDEDDTPLPNRLVDMLAADNRLEDGVSRPFAAAMLASQRDAQTTAELLVQRHLDFPDVAGFPAEAILDMEKRLATTACAALDESRQRKTERLARFAPLTQPWRYIIVATGNIYEDRTQARAAVDAGADVIAVIRSTAQSLLDYVPFGPTTEGFGGTFATQENFRIMRQALDEASQKAGRHIRLVNYASGLCMAEIAACAAVEDLDMLLNDSMYGILFRDINMRRTFIDQHFSRLICGRAGIIINTGEDNYLTTADALENAFTVTASQLINEAMAKKALLTDDLLGLGHAFEINPEIEDAFLFELAHALLARRLFPVAPLKYMPPTKYMRTDIFYSHCLDTLFNLASTLTGQGIHLTGILTEALHTPLMQDRWHALNSVNYVFKTARGLSDEIEIKKDGKIAARAQSVLNQTETFLKEIREIGLMEAISRGSFADIPRQPLGGKGLDGVFEKGRDYTNPILTLLETQGATHD